MKPLSKITAAGLMAGLILSNANIGFAESANVFTDVNASVTYKSGIEFLHTIGVIGGYDDKTYKPYQTLNRAEMLKILTKASVPGTPSAPTKKCFEDVSVTEWYAPYVCWGKDQGWVVGYENGKIFKPEQPVTSVEGLKMALEAFGIPYEKTSDIWYKGVVNTASQSNYIPFDIDNFNEGLRRDQMADLITRIIKKSDNVLDIYLGDRSEIKVSYETIEAGSNLSNSYLEEKVKIAKEMAESEATPGKPHVIITTMGNEGSKAIAFKIYDPRKNGGFPIDSYIVKKLVGTTYKPVTIIMKKSDQDSYTLENLNPGEIYSIKVSAVNSMGKEGDGDMVTFTMGDLLTIPSNKGIIPDKPSMLVTSQNDGGFSIQITAPTKNGGSAITGYLVEKKENEVYLPYGIFLKSESESGIYAFSNLDKEKTHTFRFFSLNQDREQSVDAKILTIIPKKNGEFQLY